MAQVSSYNVANRSGAQVRADINDIFEAIKTNNSGPNDPAAAEKFMLFGDNTTGDDNLKIHDGSNFRVIGKVTEDNLGLLPRAGGTMTGQLFGDDASQASSPAYAFDGDSDTGMFRATANRIGFATAGTNRVVITNTGIVTQNGSSLQLEDVGASHTVALKPPALTSDVELTLPSSITSGGFLQTDGSGNLSFQIVNGVPTGAIFCVGVNTVPTGYVKCNGASYSTSGTYAGLFAVIGYTYGGSGSSFNVPDLRGEFVRGFDDGRNVDSGRNIGSNQGAQNQSHDHNADANATSNVSDPGHRHPSRGYGNDDDGGNQFTGSGNNDLRNNAIEDATTGISVSTNVSIDIDNEGGEARPRNVALLYIIKI
tara:strand:+ start:12903 stop:14006 length:1104 start_codon:yes stop_codon:yes gene_type:complete